MNANSTKYILKKEHNIITLKKKMEVQQEKKKNL